MVKSLIDKSIEYPETKLLENDDYEFNAPTYDALVLGTKVIIAIGKANTLYIEKNILYYPIYLIKSNKVDQQIGLYEIVADKISVYKDDDDDLNIGNLEPLLYSFVNLELLKKPAKEILKDLVKEKSWLIPGVKAEYKGQEVVIKHLHNDDELPYYTISLQSGDEIQTTMENLNRIEISKISSNKELEQDDSQEQDDSEKENIDEDTKEDEDEDEDEDKDKDEDEDEGKIDDNEEKIENILPEQTEEEAKREMTQYKENEEDLWIQKYMKSNNYTIKDTGGDGDCFFTSTIEALKEIDEDKSISELRDLIVKNVDDEKFLHTKELYDMTRQELVESKKVYTRLMKQFKDIKEEIGKLDPKNKEKKISLLKLQRELQKKLIETKKEREGTENLFREYMFMKGITTLEAFKAIIKTKDYWADSWVIQMLEKELNIKFIILSQEYYRSGDIGNVIQCGDMINEEILNDEGNYNPRYYIIINYVGNIHYQLIKYKNKSIFKYSELPFEIKRKIVDKCLEQEIGVYSKIPEFKDLAKKENVKKQSGGKNSMGCILDNMLYDKNGAVLQIYSKSNPEPFPCKGSGENVGNSQLIDFIRLDSVHDDWRRKLSNYWRQKFNIDGKDWNSVEHYYQACKFKDHYPSYFNKFSLNSGSELSNIPEMAKAAGSVSGVYEGRKIRPDNIKIDPNYFNGKNKEALLKGLRAKFRDNNDLKEILMDTKDAKLQHYVYRMSPVELLDLMRIRKEIRDNK